MTISGFFKFIIGFILGTIFFGVGVGGCAYFFLSQMATNPSKPVFSEEKPKTASTPKENNKTSKPSNSTKTNSNNTSKANDKKPEKVVAKNKDLPKGAYMARVTWSTGLSLRNQPSAESERIGGVGYNEEIIILSQSDDKKWQKVRIPGSGQEAWVKAGNIKKIN